jgi:holo-[acyl-carrier protein] synthase
LSRELCGIGVSLVPVPRFGRALRRWGERMERRLFSAAELDYAGRKRRAEQNLAARFAAKCAARSALGSLLAEPVRLRDLEVTRRPTGEPTLELTGSASGSVGREELDFRLTMTHDEEFAMANVWIERARS